MRSPRSLLPAREPDQRRHGASNLAPVPYTSAAATVSSMYSSGVDHSAEMALYGNVGSVYGIVSKLANSTSAVGWNLYRKRSRNPDKGARIPVERHAAIDLWDHPNPFMERQELVEITQQYCELTGEGIWAIARTDIAGGLPLEMWPVNPDRMAPVPHPTEFMSGWVYFGPSGQRIPLGINEVIQLKYPMPGNPFRGLGPVSAVQYEAQSRHMATLWNLNFFRNSALPGGYVQFDRTLSEPEFLEWQHRWRETHKGVAAAHTVGILENATFVDASVTQRDMQFAELMRMTGDQIREPFGMPKASMGIVDDVNRANAEAANWVLANDLLIPRLARYRGKLNNQLLPMYPGVDPMLEFDHDDPRPESQEQELASLNARINAAMVLLDRGFDPEETLAAFELPPLTKVEPPAGGPPPAAPPSTDPAEDTEPVPA